MRIDWPSIRARFRRWELYAIHFINYIFHTEEGKRVRGRFIRRVIWRTFIYALWGLPAFGLLYVLNWVSFSSFGSLFGFAFLDFDIAVGIALIKTVGEYRYRIELIYRSDPAESENPDLMPLGHREVAPPVELKARKKNEEEPVDPAAYLSMLLDNPGSPGAAQGNGAPRDDQRARAEVPSSQTDQEGPELANLDGKLVLECTACKKRIHPSDRQTALRMERCIYCGSPLKKIYE